MASAEHVTTDDQHILLHGLNPLSDTLYVLVCREVAVG